MIATATSQEAAAHLEDEPAISTLVDLSVRGTTLGDAVLSATGGLGADIIIDGGDGGGGSKGGSKHELLACLAPGGKWATMHADLQLDPPESLLLHCKGASICFLNEHVWNLSGAQQGRFKAMQGEVHTTFVLFLCNR